MVVSSKYLKYYLKGYADESKPSGSKTSIKMLPINILASTQAYELLKLFKKNVENIGI
jgi:hypothetical protein